MPLSIDFVTFSDLLVNDQSGPLRLTERPYLGAVHDAMMRRRRVVLACGRQVEKTTTLLKLVFFLSMHRPGVRILFTMARFEQIRRLSRSRLWPLLTHSPLVAKVLLDPGRQPRIKQLIFRNGSELSFESVGLGADAVRGLSADVWIGDEVQDYGAEVLPVVEECLSHATAPRTILAGTSKLADNTLEIAYQRSTQRRWVLPCEGCGKESPCDATVMGDSGLRCPDCKAPLEAARGRWRAENPGAAYADGFRINQLMCPAMAYADILEKRNGYDEFVFKNEVLGEPVNLGELVFDLSALFELCLANRQMSRSLAEIPPHLRERLVAGIDYGSTARATTVSCVGALDDTYHFHVFHWHRVPAGRDPKTLLNECRDVCMGLGVRLIGADGIGHGSVLNAMLLGMLDGPQPPGLISVRYHNGTRPHYEGQTSSRGTLELPKTQAISGLLARVNDRRISFPEKGQSEPFLAEIASERCELDEETRQVRYSKSATGPDDSLHALVAAASVAQLAYSRQATY